MFETLSYTHPHHHTLPPSHSDPHNFIPSHPHTLTYWHPHTLTEDRSQPITLSHEHTSQPQTDRVIRLHQLQDQKVLLLSIFVSLACEQRLQRLRRLLRSIGLNISTFVTACHAVAPQFLFNLTSDRYSTSTTDVPSSILHVFSHPFHLRHPTLSSFVGAFGVASG